MFFLLSTRVNPKSMRFTMFIFSMKGPGNMSFGMFLFSMKKNPKNQGVKQKSYLLQYPYAYTYSETLKPLHNMQVSFYIHDLDFLIYHV